MTTEVGGPRGSTAVDERLPVRSSLPNDAPVGLYRPVAPAYGVGRWLRGLVGVEEDILDWAPEERPRYTKLGAIVVNTGVMAALSMMVAVSTVSGGAWWIFVPVGLLWAYLIVTLDSWLIASVHGVVHGAKAWLVVPRLLISLVLGATIAEPLVLLVFHQSVSNEIAEHRKREVEGYEGRLKECNPVTGAPPAGLDCAGYLVNVGGVRPLEQELAETTGLRDTARTELDGLQGRLEELERLARDECAGRAGPGLTGQAGEGGECRRNREKADQFRADNQLDAKQDALIGLDARLTELNRELGAARDRGGEQVGRAIADKVVEKRRNLTDQGLLDQFDALHRLAGSSSVVAVASWLLRLLLIAVDCMPVLTKMMSGATAYDAKVARQLESTKRLHAKHVQLHERQDTVDLEIRAQRLEQKLRNKTGDLDDEERTTKARRKREHTAQIEALAAELENHQPRT